jgi:L-ascorbate metabolism protein UlaG (beta-lactamase superfamily)
MSSSPRLPFLGACCEGLVTRRGMLKRAFAGGVLAAGGAILPTSAASEDSRRPGPKPVFSNDAYTSLIPAAIGGPMIANPHTISLRWLGCSCFELVHRGKVYLLDVWFDRGPRTRPIGFGPDEVVQTEAMFIGHAHFDHIADAPPIAARTGALIVGAPISTGYAASVGTPATQLRTVTGRGGELLEFDGFTVEPILAHHSVGPTRKNRKGEMVGQAIFDLYDAALDPFTPAETARLQTVLSRGTFDPRIITEGTIAYLFTFDSGYRLVWLDSGGPITSQMIGVMNRVGNTNLAMASYTVQGVPELQVPVTMALAELFQPDVFIPCHHDEIIGLASTPILPGGFALPDMATEPLLMTIRDTMENTRAIAPLYRSPIVANTKTGAISVA